MKTVRCADVKELDGIAKAILDQFPEQRVFAFNGKMGAGKTTLIKSVCKYLGVSDMVNSPTFSIINVYICEDHEFVYHFDLFRLKSSDELMDIGYEDYFYSGHYCLIEWPDKFEELLPGNYVYVKIEVDTTNYDRLISY